MEGTKKNRIKNFLKMKAEWKYTRGDVILFAGRGGKS